MKKIVFFVVALFFFSSVAAIGLEASVSNTMNNLDNSIKIIKKDASSAPVFSINSDVNKLEREYLPITDTPIANLPEDEIHPGMQVEVILYKLYEDEHGNDVVTYAFRPPQGTI